MTLIENFIFKQLSFTGWTNNADIASVNSNTPLNQKLANNSILGYNNIYGIYVAPGSTIYTLSGDDSISSIVTCDLSKNNISPWKSLIAVFVSGSQSLLNLGDGNNLLSGSTIYKSLYVPLAYPILTGVDNQGTILFGTGNDIIEGKASTNIAGILSSKPVVIYGVYNESIGVIDTGLGDDILRTTISTALNGSVGLYNVGKILLGDGNDKVLCSFSRDPSQPRTGLSVSIVSGIDNKGIIDLGNGNNEVNVSIDSTWIGVVPSLSNQASGIITSGNGSDSITATQIGNAGLISLGAGLDTITATQISNAGLISLGDGIDTVTGSYVGQSGSVLDFGNDNDYSKANINLAAGSKVLMGSGDDSVTGGFTTADATSTLAAGVIDLGDGNDKLIATIASKGTSFGGAGLDSYLTQSGGYQVKVYTDYFDVTALLSTGLPSTNIVHLYGFESFGSSVTGGATITPADGKYLFGTDGSITKVA